MHEERWATVAFAIVLLLLVKDELLWGWDLSKLVKDAVSSENDEDNEHSFGTRIRLFDKYVRDELFWCWLAAMRSVGRTLVHTIEWIEGCSCHFDLLKEAQNNTSSLARKSVALWKTCVWRGCRCACLAEGKLHHLICKLFEEAGAEILFRVNTLTTDETIKSTVLAEFESARVYLMFHFALKLSYTTVCPFQVHGLMSNDHLQVLKSWALVKAALARNGCHARLLELRTGELGKEVERWEANNCKIDIEDVEQYPLLIIYLIELHLGEVGERWVERPHAASQKAIKRARNHSVTYVDSVHCWPLIQKEFERDPSAFGKLAEFVDKVTNPVAGLRLLGLAQHPALRQTERSRSKLLPQIIYNADPYSLYTWKPPVVEVTTSGLRARAIAGLPSTPKERFVHKIKVEHVCNILKSDQETGGELQNYFSMPFAKQAMHRLEALLFGTGTNMELNVCGEFSLQLDPDVPGLDQVTCFRRTDGTDRLVLIFKLISARAHLKHLEFRDFKMQSEAVVVAPHQCTVVDVDAQLLEVRSTPMMIINKASTDNNSSVLGLSLASLTSEQLQDVYKWEYKNTNTLVRWRDFVFVGCNDVTDGCKEELLKLLMTTRVGLVPAALDSEEMMRAIQWLVDLQHVSDGPPFKLTNVGKRLLLTNHVIRDPKRVLRRADPSKDFEAMSAFELYTELTQDGFQHNVLVIGETTKNIHEYTKDGAKLMYQKGTDNSVLFNSYMIALLRCSRKGKPTKVAHFKTNSFYNDLLELPGGKKQHQIVRSAVLKRSNFREDEWPDDVDVFVPKRQRVEHEGGGVAGDEPAASSDPPPLEFEGDGGGDGAGDGEESGASANEELANGSGDSDDSTDSGDSKSEGTPEGAAVHPADAVEDHDPEPAGPRRHGAQVGPPKRGALFPKERWCNWSYQPYMRHNGLGGLQMFCINPEHNLRGRPACARQLADSKTGGPEATLRILKQWAVLGVKDCGSKEDHATLFQPLFKQFKDTGLLPMTDAELEEFAMS